MNTKIVTCFPSEYCITQKRIIRKLVSRMDKCKPTNCFIFTSLYIVNRNDKYVDRTAELYMYILYVIKYVRREC